MYDDADLNAAEDAGVLAPGSADAVRRFIAQTRQTTQADDETFRLLTGFNDIFVVIACVLFLIAVGWIAGATALPAAGVAVAACAWLLAEFFTRKRRMALPSIVLLLAFVGGAFFAVMAAGGFQANSGVGLIAPSACAAVAAWLHWRRFRVPITVSIGTGALIALVTGTLLAIVPPIREWTSALFLLAGLVVFALALHWDNRDRARLTYRSDVAFWLHLQAAPLIVHATFSASLLGPEADRTLQSAAIVVAVYLILAIVSVAIDRRALMVAALGYVLYTFSALLKVHGVVTMNFAITALTVGALLLLVSAFWQALRRQVVGRLPVSLQQRLPAIRDELSRA